MGEWLSLFGSFQLHSVASSLPGKLCIRGLSLQTPKFPGLRVCVGTLPAHSNLGWRALSPGGELPADAMGL